MKEILLSVDCANEFASDFPGYFCRTLTRKDIDRIKQLHGLVEAFDVDEISEFDFDGVWSKAELDGEDEDEQMTYDTAGASPAQVDIPRLVVCAEYFYWRALPDSLGDHMRLKTEHVPMSYLSSDDNQFTCFY